MQLRVMLLSIVALAALFFSGVLTRARTVAPSIDAECRSCCESRPQLFALFQIRSRDLLGPQDLVGGLRMGANDERVSDRLQPPTGCNAFDLLRSIAPVAAGTHHHGVRSAV